MGFPQLEGRVRKAVGSCFTSNPDVVRTHLDGRLEVELVPQVGSRRRTRSTRPLACH